MQTEAVLILGGWQKLSVDGWHIDKRITTDFIYKETIKVVNLGQPSKGLAFHIDRGSQHTSKHFRTLLDGYGIRSSH